MSFINERKSAEWTLWMRSRDSADTQATPQFYIKMLFGSGHSYFIPKPWMQKFKHKKLQNLTVNASLSRFLFAHDSYTIFSSYSGIDIQLGPLQLVEYYIFFKTYMS